MIAHERRDELAAAWLQRAALRRVDIALGGEQVAALDGNSVLLGQTSEP